MSNLRASTACAPCPADGGRPAAAAAAGRRMPVSVTAALALVLALGIAAPARAEFRSVVTAGAVLFDAPSAAARKLYVAPAGMPVEVLSTLPNWVKARDLGGDAFWLPAGDLGTRRMLIATAPAVVRAAPQETASPVLSVERGVLLELIEASPAGFARVRHRDGVTGWVRAADVWGL